MNVPLLITFVIYMLGMIAIGFLAWRSTKNFDDYILGGRRLGSLVTALSAGASDMSGWLLMGLPGAVFLSGLSVSWVAIGLIIGAWLNWRIVAGRLRVQTEYHHNALTLPDFFAHRFEDHSHLLRVISALIILLFFTIYCASGIVAGARLFESTFAISYSSALWAGAAATIFYTFIGGFLAVSWTDTIQATLMVFALVFTPIVIIDSVGGVSTALSVIKQINVDYTTLLPHIDTIAIISFIAWGLGYFGQPHILTRFMAADSHHAIRSARRISLSWMLFCLVGAIAIGFFAIAYFNIHPTLAGGVQQNSERVFLYLASLLFNSWISGVLLSAVLAAIMSTLSCQLLVCASALTEDMYKVFLRRNAGQKELVWVGRIMVLVVASVAIVIAFNPDSRVLSLVSYAWAGFGAAFGPVVILSVCWPRMTRNGALAGMITGALTVLVWKHYQWFELYEIIPGFILSSLAIVVFSMTDKPSATAVARFMRADNAYKSNGTPRQ